MEHQSEHPPAGEGRVIIDLPEAMIFGSRLRAAREARELTVESCGQALRLPSRLLRQLEAGEYGGIDYQVYLAGYLTKYGRHVGLDEAAIETELARLTPRQPDLVVTGGVSHSRYLLERYLTAATYVVLTAVIVVPMVWLGVRGTLDRDMARLSPLDAAPVAQQDAPAAASSVSTVASVDARPAAPAAEPRQEEQTLWASMVPPSMDHASQRPAVAPVPAVAEASGSGHSLTLSLPSASWVEVTAADGSRLEYGLLPAGTQKSYSSESTMDVRIGNATGAEATLDGQPVQLDGFRRANVARFRVDVRDGKATPISF